MIHRRSHRKYWTEILSLHNEKKSKNRTKAKFAKWHLLANCTSQRELKLGSRIIKFGKYVKLLNSHFSMHSTVWIFKKVSSRSKCGYCLWAWMCLSSTRINNVYFTNMRDTDESEGVTELPRVNWKNVKWKNSLK